MIRGRFEVEDAVSQVNVTINGRQFRMACEDGQEDHLQQLARDLDERIVALRGQFGEIGDARLTVMAALMVADELAETGKKLKRLEADHAALQDAARRRRPMRNAGHADRHRRRLQLGGRANRGHGQEAQPERRCAERQRRAGLIHAVSPGMAGSGGPIRTTLAGRGCGVRQRHIPRGLTISKGAVPGRDPGFGHMAPTYLCRFPGSRSDGHRGSALSCFRRGMDFGPVDDDGHSDRPSRKTESAQDRVRAARRAARRRASGRGRGDRGAAVPDPDQARHRSCRASRRSRPRSIRCR